MKATHASGVEKFEDIPNIGPAMVEDFVLLNIKTPEDLKSCNALEMYEKLCKVTGERHDPCVLDTFMAAVDFMNGGAVRPWWDFTEERKKQFPDV